jgi:hypothetical protein
MSNFMKARRVGVELLHSDSQMHGRTDRRTDITKLIVAFRNSAKASKNTTHDAVAMYKSFTSRQEFHGQWFQDTDDVIKLYLPE